VPKKPLRHHPAGLKACASAANPGEINLGGVTNGLIALSFSSGRGLDVMNDVKRMTSGNTIAFTAMENAPVDDGIE